MIDFAPTNRSIMANKLASTNVERFLSKTDKISAYALIAWIISLVDGPKVAKIAIFKPR